MTITKLGMPFINTQLAPLKISASVLFVLIVAISNPANADAQKGLEIVKAADERDSGWGDMTAEMEMTLYNRAGQTSTRRITSKTLEGKGDGDKTMSLFKEPKDVSGTAMLTFSHGLEPDDQWLYLPALKRVKRIASKNKSGPFMGSEFAFEDLGSQEIEKYSYRYLEDQPCGEAWTCHVIERTPAYEHSGYTRQLSWIDSEEYRVSKIEFYDRKSALLKTLQFSNYQEFNGYWRALLMTMENHQNGKKTELKWKNYQFGTGLSDSEFNQNALSRLR